MIYIYAAFAVALICIGFGLAFLFLHPRIAELEAKLTAELTRSKVLANQVAEQNGAVEAMKKQTAVQLDVMDKTVINSTKDRQLADKSSDEVELPNDTASAAKQAADLANANM